MDIEAVVEDEISHHFRAPCVGEVEEVWMYGAMLEICCVLRLLASSCMSVAPSLTPDVSIAFGLRLQNEELRGVVVTRLLEEMFTICQLPMLPPPPQLVLAMPRANDILPSRLVVAPRCVSSLSVVGRRSVLVLGAQ